MTLRADAKALLKRYVEQIEALGLERKELGDDQKALFAEAKSNGLNPKAIRKIIKRRDKDPHELAEEETIFDAYMVALDMAPRSPLHEQIAALVSDELGRDEVAALLQQLCPHNGEIIAKVGGKPIRVWRDEEGAAYAAEHVEAPPAPAERAGKALDTPAAVLTLVPKDPVQAAADRAEKRSKRKPADDESAPSPEDEPVE